MTYNKSEIMTAANALRKAHNLTKSEALRAAWLYAKITRLNKNIDALSYADRFTVTEREDWNKMTTERNSLTTVLYSIIPAPVSAASTAYDLKEKMAWDAYTKGDTATYYRLKHMHLYEFMEQMNAGAFVA